MVDAEPAASREEFRLRLAVAAGDTLDPALLAAFRAVPRDLFLGTVYYPKGIDPAAGFEEIEQGSPGWWRMMAIPEMSFPATLSAVTQGRPQVPINASTAPLTLLRLLDLAELSDGQRVLHVGTGPGYLAGVLSARLGPENVTSIDLLEENVVGARENLRKLVELGVISQSPQLHTADGRAGFVDRAPYDLIVSTMTPERVPPAWAPQLADDGRVVTEIGGPAAGRVVVLRPDGTGQLSGSFVDLASNIMRDLTVDSADPVDDALTPTIEHPGTYLTERELLYDDFLFFLQLHRSDLRITQSRSRSTTDPLEFADRAGNYARVWAFGDAGGGPHRVVQGGPGDAEALWDVVEETYCRWNQLGRPRADRLGMTTLPPGLPTGAALWLEHPSNPLSTQFPRRSPHDSPRPRVTQTPGYEPFPPDPWLRALQAGVAAAADAATAQESSFGRAYRRIVGRDPGPWQPRSIPGSRHFPRQ